MGRSSLPSVLLALMTSSLLVACQWPATGSGAGESQLSSEIDSFSPRMMPIDRQQSRAALAFLNEVTQHYLGEAVAAANRQPACSGRCMALLVSETLASSGVMARLQTRLDDIRAGRPYRRWGKIPPLPGWRGFAGAIEALLSKGRTPDERFEMVAGVLRFGLDESVFENVSQLDSPGSYLEVGTILPIEMAGELAGEPAGAGEGAASPSIPDGELIFVGSDKFGHFLSTGYEYLESYLETYDETLTILKDPAAADQRALMSVHVRGLLTEVTTLGGWLARVFSYGDLAANYAGFLFFKDIVDGTSPYLVQDAATGQWRLTERPFHWLDLVDASWDESLNCSHYFRSVGGTNQFKRKIVARLVDMRRQTGQDVSCPAKVSTCEDLARRYEERFGPDAAEALISPQCREIAKGERAKPVLTERDLGRDEAHYDKLGFYSGEAVTKKAMSWCERRRDALVAERCASKLDTFGSLAACQRSIPRVTVERFRCQLDLRDFLGWGL